MPRPETSRPPSTWWLVVSGVIWSLAAASMIAAIVHQDSVTEPIGEGEVFLADAARAGEIANAAASEDEGVRRARNELTIEAVSLVDLDGMITASTSESLTMTSVDNPYLQRAIDNGRFAALAGSISDPVQIDGVSEWVPGDILYQVLSPQDDGARFVLLHYDIGELLGRRAQPGDIEPLTIQLLGLGGVFLVLGAAVFVGHSRVSRRHREMAVESELLRKHSRELEEANAKLAAARRRAEHALALAEEKMRIRSEFVLMINHELRTPLTSVVTGAELLGDGQLQETEHAEVVASMIANGRRLNEIIDQILAVARMENRGLAYDLEEVPLEEVCRAAKIPVTTPGTGNEGGIAVQTDVRTLTLVIRSLADNARTHGATKVDLGWGLSPIQTMHEVGDRPTSPVFFTISDDGPGIDPGFLPRAFEKFEKRSFSSGTGLGLYMVRLMVEALGGSVGVRTSPGGTIFQIALPARVDSRVAETV